MISEVAKARLERARSRSLLICTPTRRDPVWQYTASFGATLLLLQAHGIRVGFEFLAGSNVICRARNELCARFLASDYTDMIFIDDDMEWHPRSVVRLLASDKPLIGGVGRMRVEQPNDDPSVWCWRPKLDSGGKLIQDDLGNIEALGFGAAFMLISRTVLDTLRTANPDWKRIGEKEWPEEVRQNYYQFFQQNDGRYPGDISEDYVFCNRWTETGGSIWVDPSITLGHVGSYNYKGSIMELMTPG